MHVNPEGKLYCLDPRAWQWVKSAQSMCFVTDTQCALDCQEAGRTRTRAGPAGAWVHRGASPSSMRMAAAPAMPPPPAPGEPCSMAECQTTFDDSNWRMLLRDATVIGDARSQIKTMLASQIFTNVNQRRDRMEANKAAPCSER